MDGRTLCGLANLTKKLCKCNDREIPGRELPISFLTIIFGGMIFFPTFQLQACCVLYKRVIENENLPCADLPPEREDYLKYPTLFDIVAAMKADDFEPRLIDNPALKGLKKWQRLRGKRVYRPKMAGWIL
jgi:hypothetical protein